MKFEKGYTAVTVLVFGLADSCLSSYNVKCNEATSTHFFWDLDETSHK